MNNKLNKILLNIAVVFMIAELSYINSKSLLHLASNHGNIHQVFAIVGAIAFSIVTIRVMQEPGIRWQKIVFPLFDAALVFLGFNLELHPSMRIYLTIFMSVFTGIIMYSLGLIEYRTHDSNINPELQQHKDRANSLGKKLDSLKTELLKKQDLLAAKNTQLTSLQTQFEKLQTDNELMRPIYLKSEKSRILKKNENNRTDAEVAMLEECA